MKIYFCGSIRGGRSDAALYARMIGALQRHGEVLTEHVGDPTLTEYGGDGPDDRAIWRRDTAWLRQCDLVVAECGTPSLGVGYELGYAESLGKEVHIFYSRDKGRLSAMLAGNAAFHIHLYRDEAELLAALELLFAGRH